MEINQNHNRKWIAILKWLRLPISTATESTKGLSWGRREAEWTFAAKQTWVITLAVCNPKATKEKPCDLLFLRVTLTQLWSRQDSSCSDWTMSNREELLGFPADLHKRKQKTSQYIKLWCFLTATKQTEQKLVPENGLFLGQTRPCCFAEDCGSVWNFGLGKSLVLRAQWATLWDLRRLGVERNADDKAWACEASEGNRDSS